MASTDVQCLYGPAGCNGITLGDWTADVPYPIADDRAVYGKYGRGYFPTIVVVYPDRTVYELEDRSLAGIETMIANAPKLEAGVNPGFLELDVIGGSFCEPQTGDAKYVINNKGEENITSADIQVTVNGEVMHSENWAGDVKSWGIVNEIVVPDLNITENSVIEFRMDNINGDNTKSFSHSSDVVIEVGSVVTVTVQTDADAGNSFSIINFSGGTIDFIADEQLDEPFQKYEFEYRLKDLSCHIMEIVDRDGNGTEGSVEVKDNIGNVIFNNADFGGVAEIVFNVSQNTSVNDVLTDVAMNLSPNPVTDLINLELNLESAKQLNLTVTAISGKVIQERTLSNLQSLAEGLYFLNVNDGQGNLTTKFIKQ